MERQSRRRLRRHWPSICCSWLSSALCHWLTSARRRGAGAGAGSRACHSCCGGFSTLAVLWRFTGWEEQRRDTIWLNFGQTYKIYTFHTRRSRIIDTPSIVIPIKLSPLGILDARTIKLWKGRKSSQPLEWMGRKRQLTGWGCAVCRVTSRVLTAELKVERSRNFRKCLQQIRS